MTRVSLIGTTMLALLALSAPATAGDERGEKLGLSITECLNAGGTSITVATEKDTVAVCIPKGVVSDYVDGWRGLLSTPEVTGGAKAGSTPKKRRGYDDQERREMDRLIKGR